jgi:hypothetical protein
MFIIIKKGEIAGTKLVCEQLLLGFDDNKILKVQIGFASVYSSVKDHRLKLLWRIKNFICQRTYKELKAI